MKDTKIIGRKEYAIKNTLAQIASYIVNVVLKFVVRTVFIIKLGDEILGLNGIFSSILSVFSLAEMGFGTILWILLYKPIAENDKEKIKTIVKFSKKIFTIVFFVIIIGSACLIPLLPIVINDIYINYWTIVFYYVLFALSSSLSYLIAHKSILIGAYQKGYVSEMIILFFNILTVVCQLLALFLLKSFVAYLVINIVFTLLKNVFTNKICNRMFPFIVEKNIQPLNDTDKKFVKTKVTSMLYHKTGSVISDSVESILLSIFISTLIVGKFSNYALIVTSVTAFVLRTINGSMASIGNLWTTSSREKAYEIYNKISFLQFWIVSFCSVTLFVLIQPFISLWIGDQYLFDIGIVILYILIFYLQRMQFVVSIFKENKGIIEQDKFRPLIEALVNIVLAVIFLQFMGILGIFLGSLCSKILTYWYETMILFKDGFQMSTKKYYPEYILRFFILFATTAITYHLCSFLGSDIKGFILKTIICAILPNLIFLLIFFKNKYFKYYIDWIKEKLKKKNLKTD